MVTNLNKKKSLQKVKEKTCHLEKKLDCVNLELISEQRVTFEDQQKLAKPCDESVTVAHLACHAETNWSHNRRKLQSAHFKNKYYFENSIEEKPKDGAEKISILRNDENGKCHSGRLINNNADMFSRRSSRCVKKKFDVIEILGIKSDKKSRERMSDTENHAGVGESDMPEDLYLTAEVCDDDCLAYVEEIGSMEECCVSHEKFELPLQYPSHCRQHRHLKCDNCGKYFEGENKSKNHNCVRNRTNMILTDQVCKEEPSNGMMLNLHILDDRGRYHCYLCDSVFVNDEDLNSHSCIVSTLEQQSVDITKARESRNDINLSDVTLLEDDFLLADDKSPEMIEVCENDKPQVLLESGWHALEPTDHLVLNKICKFCGIGFKRLSTLKTHLSKHVDEKFQCSKRKNQFVKPNSLISFARVGSSSKCEHCDRNFTSQIQFERHRCMEGLVNEGFVMKTAHGGYKCMKCGMEIKHKLSIKRHILKHTGEISCQICSKHFGAPSELFRHKLICFATVQLSKEGEVLQCTVCSETFQEPLEYRKHYLHHTHPFQCESCGRRFKRLNRLAHHVCSSEREDSSLECHICHKTFAYDFTLRKHVTQVHGNRKLACERCHRLFKHQDTLNNHMCSIDGQKVRIKKTKNREEIIHDSPLYVCSICGKNFSTLGNLNLHAKTHGERKEACEICGKKFHHKTAVKEHVEHVHKRVGVDGQTRPNFQCEQCWKVFRSVEKLKIHSLVHSNVQQSNLVEKHSCNLCSRSFKNKINLESHINVYHGASSYRCKYCGTVCRRFYAIKRHMQHRHADVSEWLLGGTNFLKSFRIDSTQYINVKTGDSVRASKRDETDGSAEGDLCQDPSQDNVNPSSINDGDKEVVTGS